jgi:uncharacterized coiled-coil protein SlyX
MHENRQEIEARIQSLEEHLATLRGKLAALEEKEQHKAIDHLDDYMKAVDNELDSLRRFWPEAIKELRRLVGKP